MSTILVEARRDPASGPALERLAAVCHALGHDTFRWRGPLSGRVPYWRRLFACDLAILWNGAHPRYEPIVSRLQRRGTKLIFVELGWNPQRGTIQIDPAGVNARASWSAQPLACLGRTPLAVRPDGDLLVVLQLDRDTQITQLSPHFRDMHSFVEFVSANSMLPVRVRAHPRQVVGTLRVPLPAASDSARAAQAADGTRSVPATLHGTQSVPTTLHGTQSVPATLHGARSVPATWDHSPSFAAALARAKAVATINSSCGVEALAAGLPVLCYGEAIYRHPSAVYCLNDDPQATRDATAELATGSCRLFQEPIAALVERIAGRQWTLDQIDQRLPELLARTLAGAPTESDHGQRWLAPLIRWARDLPPRLLPA